MLHTEGHGDSKTPKADIKGNSSNPDFLTLDCETLCDLHGDAKRPQSFAVLVYVVLYVIGNHKNWIQTPDMAPSLDSASKGMPCA